MPRMTLEENLARVYIPSKPKDVSAHLWYRFWYYTQLDYDSCVLWRGEINDNGYGVMVVKGQQVLAHRLSYELCADAIPYAFHIHHICRNRRCVNPAHLVAISAAQHMALHGRTRSERTDKGFCKRGHERTEENTYVAPDGNRSCRICRKEWEERHREYRRQRDRRNYYAKKAERDALRAVQEI